ncbi:tetratricopeptide repeat protein [Priestia megaterium]|uniref:tetratricopeptide repeat protein n=1 Tax=Priestia megaterium TaxID=1404 RepID=UPI0022B8BF35|nr:tetratricopeptide repeat protein [Priestia megaterium]MCZ8495571.1 tetratricopeptide repeat protein [Priestia megaterium]
MIPHEIEMKGKIENIISGFVRELHSTVHTEVDFFYITNNGIQGPSKIVELIQQSNFFNVSNQQEETKIIEYLNNKIQGENLNISNKFQNSENIEIDNSLNYFNYLFLSDSNEKILFLFTFQGFEDNVIEMYKRGTSYSFLRFLLDRVFKELKYEKISSILDEKVYENKPDILSVFVREFTEELVKNICETSSNNLYNELYYISSLNYEGSVISAKLMILNEQNMDKFVDFSLKLSEKIRYKEHRKIRKILEISDDNMYLIGDDKYVYGVGKAKKFGEIRELKKEDKILVIDFLGKFEFSLNLINISKEIISQSGEYFEDIRWSWNEINCVQVKYGKPSLQENQLSIEALSDSLKKSFNSYFQERNYTPDSITDKVSTIINIVQHATKQKHGTMLVIAKPDLAVKEIDRLENQSIKVMKTVLLRKDSKHKSNNIIERITSIDGALYLDIEGYCYAMGVILDGVAEKGQGDTSRGARYNSAIKYYNIEDVEKNCVIVIISEDGMVDVIPDSKIDKQKANRILNEIKSLTRVKDFNKALEKANQLTEFDDPVIKMEAYVFQAYFLLHLKGARKEQIGICNKAIKIDENYITAYLLRAKIYGDLKEYDKAINDYNKVIELNPTHENGYNNRGLLYTNLKEYDRALDDYNKAIELNPTRGTYYYNRGSLYDDLKEYNKAIDDYTKAIELDPTYEGCYNNRGLLYEDLKEYNKAINDYTKTIELNPTRGTYYYNRGSLYDDLKEYNKAIDDYTKAIELDPTHEGCYNNRGLLYEDLKEYDKALDDYTKTIELNPTHGTYYYNRGSLYDDLKEYDKALDDYTKAIELGPTDADFYNNRGLLYKGLKEYDRALDDYNKAIELNPTDQTYYYNRGFLYDNLKEYDKAIDDYTKAIGLNPTHEGCYNNRGLLYEDLKEYDKALDDYTKTIELNPTHGTYYYNRGLVYEHLKEYDKAIDDYYEAIQLNRSSLKFYERLNTVFNKLIEVCPEKEKEYKHKIQEMENLKVNKITI